MGSAWAQTPFHRESARRFGLALEELACAFEAEGLPDWAANTRAHREYVESGDPRAIDALIDLLYPRRMAEAPHEERTVALADAIRTMAESTLAQRSFRERVSLVTWREWRRGIVIVLAFLIFGTWPLWGVIAALWEMR